ncbi:hypothetical protein KHS38_11940 [Mucilaginibacter sp. Bleaf8]|uniref:hypothetical protein n=1 Tax=Mucilaginibacter sp. Bleaf8 TaxID=2834430 RepID=UPI001BCBDBE3|nr:hypothetical protein [Mucilaginibacter sp. Bleaf8]MBS7565117.1 hypothetical protein [Mucilaginibacter sp. Bleaf8]
MENKHLWPTIEAFLQHTFKSSNANESGPSRYELFLDCLTIKLRNPIQKLPILCLVSNGRPTGKSTLLWMIDTLFELDCINADSEMLAHRGNGWAESGVVCIDGGFLSPSMIRVMVTNLTSQVIRVRNPYEHARYIKSRTWFICATNEQDRVYDDYTEGRFWIQHLHPVVKDDHFLYQKLCVELPEFKSFLKGRQPVNPPDFMYGFNPDLYSPKTTTV